MPGLSEEEAESRASAGGVLRAAPMKRESDFCWNFHGGGSDSRCHSIDFLRRFVAIVARSARIDRCVL